MKTMPLWIITVLTYYLNWRFFKVNPGDGFMTAIKDEIELPQERYQRHVSSIKSKNFVSSKSDVQTWQVTSFVSSPLFLVQCTITPLILSWDHRVKFLHTPPPLSKHATQDQGFFVWFLHFCIPGPITQYVSKLLQIREYYQIKVHRKMKLISPTH